MIEIYGTSACNWCKEAQKLCVQKNQDYMYHQVDMVPALLDDLEKRLGKRVRTVPQIFLDGDYIGGYSELEEKLNG